MKRSITTAIVFFLLTGAVSAQSLRASSADGASSSEKGRSKWVYRGSDGKLVYETTSRGDRIMDFSHAGYMGGGAALPAVPVKRVIQPSGMQDDTELIQTALNELAAMPLENGFRGAVQLAPGVFTCSGTITIPASGIVLRGSGSGKGGTTIKMTGGRHTAIVIGERNPSDRSEEMRGGEGFTSAETLIADAYVPSGAMSFTAASVKGFAAGDRIEIRRPVTKAWVHFMEMDNLVRDGRPQTWIGANNALIIQRKITAISGNKITLDAPLADSFDSSYLNPPGTIVIKVKPSSRITQAGLEYLHVQCPPLETSYGRAPYSGVRINGDDCWVRDVYFEETMNTAVFAGNRNTMQQVVIKHTYTNLGASKPADFSFEGSQNLIDRCESTGGNTYFVWTGSLDPGPNVVLNSTFRGHGSRLQPHQRWSTGMLIDNCTIVDGGIDYSNRGVAGSGHGWTMGWGVVWNSIAKTYIIQNPPGAANWAIGNIGERQQTARYFDTAPILPEGYFDSHGTPVAPQSLYLAQLAERSGEQALKNIGYASNTENMFTNRSVKPLPPLKVKTDPVLGVDLALHRPVNTSNIRGETREFSGEKAVDANSKTYWAVNDDASASIEIDMEGPAAVNAVEIAEAAGFRGRIQRYKVEGQVDSDWKLLSQGTTIGKRKVDKFPQAIVWKVRLTVLKAEGYPAISKVGLYLEKASR